MNGRPRRWQRWGMQWLGFWFAEPPLSQLALMRIGTGLVLLYVLLVHTFDLEIHFSSQGWAGQASLRALDPMAWPFSFFDWFEATAWLWAVHIGAMLTGVAFLFGVYPTATGALSMLFLLSYGHRNPAVLLELDGLVLLGLFYLSLTPCGRVLSALPVRPKGPVFPLGLEPEPDTLAATWGSFPVRVLQLHLCVLYLLSGLGRMSPLWLSGAVLWNPGMAEPGTPIDPETLNARPYLVPLVTQGLALFELFYAVLIWFSRLRYAMLGLAVLAHLTVGILWDLMPFSLMMLVLNLSFVPPLHLAALTERMAPLLTAPWALPRGRT